MMNCDARSSAAVDEETSYSFKAVVHTTMDRFNDSNKKAAIRMELLKKFMPSITEFLGDSSVITNVAAADVIPVDCPLEDQARGIALEGPIQYTDLVFNLNFDRPIEIWIDTMTDVCKSTIDVKNRFLFLLEPDEITRSKDKVLECASHFNHIFSHDPAILSEVSNASGCRVFS
jgi:hypothetical protein